MILEPVTASAKRSASLPAQPAQRPTPRSVSPCPSLQYPSVQFFKAPKPLELAPSALSLATAATDGTLGACARPSSLPDPVPLLTHSTPRIAQAPVFAPVLPSLESKFQFLKSPTRREAGHRDNSDLQELERHVLELVEGLQLPLEVKYWTRQQLEVFVMSGGVLRPKNCSMPDERLLANASMSKDEIVHSLAQAAEWIANADALLIGSGAGMGVDSGLGTFRGGKKGVWDGLEAVGLAYEEICEPRWFDETSGDPRLAWGFWNHCYRAYQETKPHSGYGALKQLVFVAASSNIFAAMPISGLLSAAALGGVGQTIWQYNRENYMFDVPLRQAREFQVQNVNLARFALFREDIRDLAALTTDKVANLLIVNTLKVGFIVALYFNFDRTDSGFQERTYQEDQLAVLLGMTLLTSFFFLMTSIWFAMHALQLAQAITTKLLVQVVRIPMPSENEIAKASTEGKDFELNFREALRLPFVRPAALNKDTLRDQMKDVGRQLPQLAEEMNREDSRLSNDTRAASPAAAAQSPTDSKGSPLLQTTRPLNMEVSMQELLHCLPSHAQGAFSEMEPHLKLLCLVASAWQPFDLYSRVTTVLGSSCLFSGLAYFSLYYNKFDVDGSSSMPTEAWCSFLFMSTLAWWNLTIEIAGSKLDLFVAALLILVGPTLWVASNKPTLHASVMQHFGYPVLVTIQASWICFLGIRAFTCGGEWPHFFTSTRYLNVVHKQRGPIEIPVDIARKVHEDEDTSTESSVNFKDSQHAMALAQPLIDVLSCIGDLPQSSSSRAAVFQARDWLREAARAAGVLRTSLMVKGFWIYLPMTGLDNEGAVPHWVDIHSIDYPENCKDATEAFMLPELLQAADLAAETLHAQAVRWTVHDMLRLASYGGEPVTGVNSFLFQFENISERMRTFVPSADYLFKVAMGLVSLFWIMVWVWSIMAATELFRKVSLSGTMQPFALDTPWRTVISFGCTLEGEHYVVTDSVVVQILSEEGRVWLQFGACDGDPILAVDFGQQGEVVATCERGIQATWLSGAKFSAVRKFEEAPWAAELRGQGSSSGDDLWSVLVTVAEAEMERIECYMVRLQDSDLQKIRAAATAALVAFSRTQAAEADVHKALYHYGLSKKASKVVAQNTGPQFAKDTASTTAAAGKAMSAKPVPVKPTCYHNSPSEENDAGEVSAAGTGRRRPRAWATWAARPTTVRADLENASRPRVRELIGVRRDIYARGSLQRIGLAPGIEVAGVTGANLRINRAERSVTVRLPVSKTDLEGKGCERRHVCVCSLEHDQGCPHSGDLATMFTALQKCNCSSGRHPLCVFHALLELVVRRRKQGSYDPSHPLFGEGQVAVTQRQLTQLARVCAFVLQRETLSEWSASALDKWSQHCFRVAGTQLFARAGISLAVIQVIGIWGSMAVMCYVQDAIFVPDRAALQVRSALTAAPRSDPSSSSHNDAGQIVNSAEMDSVYRRVVAECWQSRAVFVHNMRTKFAHKPCENEQALQSFDWVSVCGRWRYGSCNHLRQRLTASLAGALPKLEDLSVSSGLDKQIVKTLEPLKLGAKIGDVQIKLDDVVLDVAAAVLEHMVDAHMSTATVPPGSQTQATITGPRIKEYESAQIEVSRIEGPNRSFPVHLGAEETLARMVCENETSRLFSPVKLGEIISPRNFTRSRQANPWAKSDANFSEILSLDASGSLVRKDKRVPEPQKSLTMIDAFEPVRWAMVFARWGEEFVIGPFVDFFINLVRDNQSKIPQIREEGVTKIITSAERHDALESWMPPDGKGKGKDNDGKGKSKDGFGKGKFRTPAPTASASSGHRASSAMQPSASAQQTQSQQARGVGQPGSGDTWAEKAPTPTAPAIATRSSALDIPTSSSSQQGDALSADPVKAAKALKEQCTESTFVLVACAPPCPDFSQIKGDKGAAGSEGQKLAQWIHQWWRPFQKACSLKFVLILENIVMAKETQATLDDLLGTRSFVFRTRNGPLETLEPPVGTRAIQFKDNQQFAPWQCPAYALVEEKFEREVGSASIFGAGIPSRFSRRLHQVDSREVGMLFIYFSRDPGYETDRRPEIWPFIPDPDHGLYHTYHQRVVELMKHWIRDRMGEIGAVAVILHNAISLGPEKAGIEVRQMNTGLRNFVMQDFIQGHMIYVPMTFSAPALLQLTHVAATCHWMLRSVIRKINRRAVLDTMTMSLIRLAQQRELMFDWIQRPNEDRFRFCASLISYVQMRQLDAMMLEHERPGCKSYCYTQLVKVQDQFWVSNISNLQDVSVDRSPLQDTVHLDAIAISGTRLVGLRYHRDSTWREVGILNVPPHKGLFTAVAVRMGRA
ncbi:unnamed protein product, partial [Symbiodinium microadriaticum]